MNKTLLLLIGILIILSACTPEKEGALVPPDHSGWRRTTEIELDYPIPGHESNYRIIYINSIGEDYTISQRDGRTVHEYPEGTIIIKDVYPGLTPEPEAEPVMQTVMIKDPEHPANSGGWVWVVKDLMEGGETVMEGQFCFGCHTNANERHPYGDENINEEFRDYVFFPPAKE